MRILTRGQARGFSLMDAVVALLLFVALFAAGMRFITALNSSTETAFARSQMRLLLDEAHTVLDADITQAQACVVTTGLASPFSEFGDANGEGFDSMRLWVDVDSDGDLDLVAWRVEDGRLQRAVRLNEGVDCATLDDTPMAGGDWDTALKGLRHDSGANTTYFQGVIDNRAAYYRGSCEGVEAASCAFDGVRVRFVAEQSAVAGPAEVDRVYEIPEGAGRR